MMLLSKKILKNKPIWQYIVFSYNEKDIEIAKEIALKENIIFKLVMSNRFAENDSLKPINSDLYVKKN